MGRFGFHDKGALLPIRMAQDDDGERGAGEGSTLLSVEKPCHSGESIDCKLGFPQRMPALSPLLHLREGTRGWCILETCPSSWEA